MRRMALFSDVHGNVPALNAVLDDISASGAQEVYCLGDLVGYGPDPAGVIDLIRTSRIPTVLGNYDEGVGNRRGECGCYYSTDQAREDGAASYAFTDAALDDDKHAWLASLPAEIRLQEGDVPILLTHGSPRKLNEYLLPDRQDVQLLRLADQAEADIVCVGHVHIPYHRSIRSPSGSHVHYISSGSVGKPKDGDPRAAWVELLVGTHADVARMAPDDRSASPVGPSGLWCGALVHRVDYDIEAVAASMLAKGLPATLVEALRRG